MLKQLYKLQLSTSAALRLPPTTLKLDFHS